MELEDEKPVLSEDHKISKHATTLRQEHTISWDFFFFLHFSAVLSLIFMGEDKEVGIERHFCPMFSEYSFTLILSSEASGS